MALTPRQDGELVCDGHLYCPIVGSIMYPSTCTQPDVAFAVKELSQFMMDPSIAHSHQAKHCVAYLHGTHSSGIIYSADPSLAQLVGYSDADWASSADCKSTSGFVFFYASGAVSWAARQQRTVAHSSAESEYVALSMAGCECMWLRRLHAEIDGARVNPTLIYEDNQAWALWTEKARRRLKGASLVMPAENGQFVELPTPRFL